MTIFVTVSEVSKVDEWEYWYSETYNMISLQRVLSDLPRATLQGAYSLIIDVDASRIVSYFETVGSAEITYWAVVPALEIPKTEWGRVVVAQDIDDGQPQAYFTNLDYSVFYTRFGEPVVTIKLRHIAIGKQVIVDVTQDGMVVGVWMLNLPPEIGQKHAGWGNA